MFLNDRDFALYFWCFLGVPIRVFGFCMSDVKPVQQRLCGIAVSILFLALVAGAAFSCDGPFMVLPRCGR